MLNERAESAWENIGEEAPLEPELDHRVENQGEIQSSFISRHFFRLLMLSS
jgi:hypothetical protein